VLAVLAVQVMQMLQPHKTVQILFLAPSLQRVVVGVATLDKTDKTAVLAGVVEVELRLVE
jgi:hypothetical protein